MLDVLFTVDVEVRCGRWQHLDAAFPAAYRRYIHSPTACGQFRVPFQLKLLNEHKRKGIFFTRAFAGAGWKRRPLVLEFNPLRRAKPFRLRLW